MPSGQRQSPPVDLDRVVVAGAVLNAGESADVPEEDRDDKDDDEDDDEGDVVAGARLDAGEVAGAPADGEGEDEVVVGVITAVAVGGGGLSPPPPSSVAPKGICIGRNGETTMPVGEEADAAGCAMPGRVPPPPPLQFVVPAGMPPSKSDVEAGAGEVEAIALPRPEQSEFVATPAIGLKPGEASSEDPRGIPGGATGAPGPIPSGEVAPSEDGAGTPTPCARAVPQASRTIKTDMTNRTDISVRDPLRWGFTRLRW